MSISLTGVFINSVGHCGGHLPVVFRSVHTASRILWKCQISFKHLQHLSETNSGRNQKQQEQRFKLGTLKLLHDYRGKQAELASVSWWVWCFFFYYIVSCQSCLGCGHLAAKQFYLKGTKSLLEVTVNLAAKCSRFTVKLKVGADERDIWFQTKMQENKLRMAFSP